MKHWNRMLSALLAALMLTGAWSAVAELELEMPTETEGIEVALGIEDGDDEQEISLELDDVLELDDIALTEATADDLQPDPTEEGIGLAQENDSAGDFRIDENGVLVQYTGPGGDVVIPDGVTSIGKGAFSHGDVYDYSLKSVTIPDSVISIGAYAFYRCKGLTSVTMGNGVTSIGYEAFSRCTNLANLTIGNSVTSIGNFAFSRCNSLISVTIPDSVTSIGYYAFFKCTNLANLTIGNSVTSIGSYAFSWCKSLTSVSIGHNVTSIGEYAFRGCTQLKSVYITSTKIDIVENAFDEFDESDTTFYVGINTDVAQWARDNNYDVVELIALRNKMTTRAEIGRMYKIVLGENEVRSFSSSDTVIATVSEKGDISVKNSGTVQLTVKLTTGAKRILTLKIPERASLSSSEIFLNIGKSNYLKIDNLFDREVTWISSDNTIATVKKGLVTAKNEGICTVTAQFENKVRLDCVVNVIDPASISKTKLSLPVGNSEKLILTGLNDRTVTWSTSDKKVATVKDGTVTAIREGRCTITATLSNGKQLTCALTVKDPAWISCKKLSMEAGRAYTLKVYKLANRTVAWSSSNKEIATVKDGEVTAIKAGTCTITATLSNGKTLECKVTVKDVAQFAENKLTLKLGDTQKLKIYGLHDRKVTWSTSDKKVATVKDGVVKGVGVGKCTITAQIEKGKKLTCRVTVVDGAVLSKTELALLPGQTSKLSVSGVKGRELTWSSSNNKVATVDRGMVTAVAAGKCNIVVTVGDIKLVCKVTVQKPLTGDIHGILGKDRVAVNKLLPDKLRYYDYDAYTNDFFLVQTDYSDKIISIALLTDAESDIGKYTLYGLYPGMGYDKAKKMLTGKGWKLDSESYDKSFFYNPKNNNVSFYVTIENDAIDLVVYMFKE